jgi:serine/threonine protein kinase
VIGRTLSHYQIEERLGAGGMGEVYRARDEKLYREVALKVLPAGALADEESRRRFRKEAMVLSRLSHPHIATLLDFDSADGIDFLVMELVVGPTLEHELRRGPLAEKEVVRLGSQLARALVAAHAQGVIHRDLKPSNLLLTPDGLLKVLDFGVARLERRDVAPAGDTPSTQTVTGLVVGSPPYMAPEQLMGKAIDARTDLYAAGACLYELATGKRPYGERLGPQLTEAILHETPVPPWALNRAVTPGLGALILKCLDKEPGLRYQTAKELLVDLERLAQAASTGNASQPVTLVSRRRGRQLRWLVAAGAALAAVAVAGWLLRPPPTPRISDVRPLRLDIGWHSESGLVSTWATDGVRLYYVVRRLQEHRLFQVPLTGGEAAEIEIPPPLRRGLELYGFLPGPSALLGLVLPDDRAGGWPVWMIPVPRGSARRLGDLVANTADVSPDGERILLLQSRDRRLLVARVDGSEARLLTVVPPRAFFPCWAPDGRRIRFSASGPAGREAEDWIWETSDRGELPRPLWPGERGCWTRDGRHFLLERRVEPTQRHDVFVAREPSRLPWTGKGPVPLTSGPLDFTHVRPRPDGRGLLALGMDRRAELSRFDRRTGGFERFLGGPSIGYVDPSPGGQWLSWVSFPDELLWQGRRDGRERFALTKPPLRAWLPRWSPDGKRIVFVGRGPKEQVRTLRLVPAGGGPIETLAHPDSSLDAWDPCWLPDGDAIVFGSIQLQSPRSRLWKLDLRTRALSELPAQGSLNYPRCGAQGQILAVKDPPAGTFVVRRPGREAWDEIGPADLTHPVWTRDGRSFCGLGDGRTRIKCYSIAGRRYETLADTGDLPLLTWVVAPWIGLDLDDSPLVMRDASTFDLYALDWVAP